MTTSEWYDWQLGLMSPEQREKSFALIEELQERQALSAMMCPLTDAEIAERERRALAILEHVNFDQIHLSAYWLLNLDVPTWKAARERTRRVFTRLP